MIIKMKEYQIKLIDYCKRFTKGWDYYSLASDSYLNGYRHGRLNLPTDDNEVEVELNNGEHQLSTETFAKWRNENMNMSFKKAFETYMFMFDVKDIFISEDSKGNISFQGIAKRKEDPSSSKIGVQD